MKQIEYVKKVNEIIDKTHNERNTRLGNWLNQSKVIRLTDDLYNADSIINSTLSEAKFKKELDKLIQT